MVTNRRRLLRAVRLLDDVIEDCNCAVTSNSDRGSSRALLVRLRRLRELLLLELDQSEPNWRAVVAPILREAARWLVEFVNNNIQYMLSSRFRGHAGIDRGTRAFAQILSA